MSGICGWVQQAGGAAPALLDRMSEPFTRIFGSRLRSASGPSGAISVAGAAGRGDVFADGGEVAAIWGRPGFSDAELANLARREGPARALAHAYAEKGADLLSGLSGSFAFAVASSRKGEALIATDRFGVHPVFYTISNRRLLFGSRLDCIAACPDVVREIDAQAIYHYLYFHVVPGPRTIYANVYRLLPGNCLRWQNGVGTVQAYWRMRFVENERRPFEELRSEFRALLRESVARCAEGGRIGAYLSGGTDSSTIAGMLREATGEPARTYSIGFAAEGYDEMHFARIAAQHFATRHHERYITARDVVEAIPLVATAHDQPFGNSSAVPAYYCAKFAKEDGTEIMLGGDGGDELFGGNERYAKQYLYSCYSDRSAVVRKALIEPILFRLPGAAPFVGRVQRYVRHASQPMPARYDNYNLVEHMGRQTMFTGDFLYSVDPALPAAEMSEVYWGQAADSMINRMLGFDLKYTLADNDLPKVMVACDSAGVAVRFPLLDDALVGFAATLPPHLKLRGTRLRYFFKEALRDFLPGEIIAKTKHGFGLPFGPWVTQHRPLREIAFDSLAALKARGIVRPQFIDELCSERLARHAKYYGTMVWVLMMLEQWFARSPATARSTQALKEEAL